MYTSTLRMKVCIGTLALTFHISFYCLGREGEREREGGRDQSLVYFYESSYCKVIMFRLVWNWECAHQSYHLLTLGCQSPSYQKLKRCEISWSGYLKNCTCNWFWIVSERTITYQCKYSRRVGLLGLGASGSTIT